MSPETFANRFKEVREKKNVTIKALQPLVGASPSAMSGYATGKNLPPLDVAAKIAKELDVSLDWLCGLSDDMSNNNESFNCVDAAVCMDRVIDHFSCELHCETEPKPNAFFDDFEYFVNVRIQSKALFDYYEQRISAMKYYKGLPEDLKTGFAPFEEAMIQKLRKHLIDVRNEDTGLNCYEKKEEFPF